MQPSLLQLTSTLGGANQGKPASTSPSASQADPEYVTGWTPHLCSLLRLRRRHGRSDLGMRSKSSPASSTRFSIRTTGLNTRVEYIPISVCSLSAPCFKDNPSVGTVSNVNSCPSTRRAWLVNPGNTSHARQWHLSFLKRCCLLGNLPKSCSWERRIRGLRMP